MANFKILLLAMVLMIATSCATQLPYSTNYTHAGSDTLTIDGEQCVKYYFRNEWEEPYDSARPGLYWYQVPVVNEPYDPNN